MANTGGNKRKSIDSDESIVSISDLPDAVWADVAKYLARPSVALLAVALAAPSTSPHHCEPSAASKVMISSSSVVTVISSRKQRGSNAGGDQWSILDFGDIEENLAN